MTRPDPTSPGDAPAEAGGPDAARADAARGGAARSGAVKSGAIKSGAVKSARRVVEVLEHFDQVQRPQTLTEISLSLGYPASSTLALLKSLQAMDYLSYDLERRTYSPSLRVAMLGAWVQGRVFRDGVLVRIMEQLQEAIGETVVLGLQNDLHVQYIHVVQARHLLRYHLHPGTFRPVHTVAAGRMLLAHQPRDAVMRLVRQLERRGGGGVDGERLWRELEQIRADGFAWSANQVTQGAGTLAMLAPKMADGRNTVLGIAGPLARLEPNREQIRASMRAIIDGFDRAG